MNSSNIGYLYFHQYFKNINVINDQLLYDIKFKNTTNEEHSDNCLYLKSNGLIAGIGYVHDDKDNEKAFKFGMHFDYTSGQPIIPGASIKGAIRSVFPGNEKDKEIKNAKYAYIIEKTKEINNSIQKEDVDQLEREMFEGKNKDGNYKSIYERDIFNDTFICKGSTDGKIFGEDYVTPHTDRPLKNPSPVRFLKILGGVGFCFDFDFKDGCIRAEEKKKLVTAILLDINLGAKGKGGYGAFSDNELVIKKLVIKKNSSQPSANHSKQPSHTSTQRKDIYNGSIIKVTSYKDNQNIRHTNYRCEIAINIKDGTITRTAEKVYFHSEKRAPKVGDQVIILFQDKNIDCITSSFKVKLKN